MKNTIIILAAIVIISLTPGCVIREIDFREENFAFTENREGTVPDEGLYLAPVKFNDFWGYIDQHGTFFIEPYLKNAFPFSDGLALVLGDDGWGFIDETGEFIIGPGLSAARSFSEGLAAVRTSDGWGYIDTTGKQVIEPAFSYAESFSEGYAVVSSDNKRKGFIDTAGDYVIVEKYETALAFNEGIAFVYPYHNGPVPTIKSAYIYPDGSLALQPPHVGYNYGSFSEGLAPVYRQSDLLYGYMDTDGNIVIEPQFLLAFPFNEGSASVCEMGIYGYIDKSGDYFITPDYDIAQPFYNGMAAVIYYTKNGGFIDNTGKLIIDYDFQDTRSFSKIN